MTNLINQLLSYVRILLDFALAIIAPTSAANISLIHIAILVPIMFVVAGGGFTLFRHMSHAGAAARIYAKPLQKTPATSKEKKRAHERVQLYNAEGRSIRITRGTIDTIHREGGIDGSMRRGRALNEYADQVRYKYLISKRAQLGEVRYALWKRSRQGRESIKYLQLLRSHAGAISEKSAADAADSAAKQIAQDAERDRKRAEREEQRRERGILQASINTNKRIQAEQREAERAARAEARKLAQADREAARAAAKAEKDAERATRQAARQAAQADRAAQRAANPPRTRQAKKNVTSRAFGSDPNRVYEFRYKVVELDSLITSNTDTGAINPAYDQTLQPRQRDRTASQRQIEQVARRIVPDSLLLDFHQLDKGAPIIGSDSMVESGNGRALALRRARQDFPDQYENYRTQLRDRLADHGLGDRALDGIASPVLVRERITDVDRAVFAREANAPPVLQMSTLEIARVDAQRLRDESILQLHVKEEQSIDVALRKKDNAPFVRDFLGDLSENESAALMRKNGTLSQAGIQRIKAAVFTKVFPGEAGQRIADTFLEALDSTTKNFENGISSTLPQLARAESLMASGQRDSRLRITEDVSKALDVLARLRENDMSVSVYLDQSNMFERELDDNQEQLLRHFDKIGRSSKTIRQFFSEYAQAVEDAPDPGQIALFNDEITMTKESLLKRIMTSQELNKIEQADERSTAKKAAAAAKKAPPTLGL